MELYFEEQADVMLKPRYWSHSLGVSSFLSVQTETMVLEESYLKEHSTFKSNIRRDLF